MKAKQLVLFSGIVLALFVLVDDTNGANILFYFGVSSYSHRLIFWPYMEKLVARGHKVTFFSGYVRRDQTETNITELVAEPYTTCLKLHLESDSDELANRFNGNFLHVMNVLPLIGIQGCQALFEDPNWNLWANTAKYDLVVVNAMYNECGLAIAYRMGAKVMYIKTQALFPWEPDTFGFPMETSWVPPLHHGFDSIGMKFTDRIKNFAFPIYNYWYHRWLYQPALDDILKKGFNLPDFPSIYELQDQISVVLINTHYSTDYARSLPPMFIPVGGMLTHRKPTPMSPEMSKFVEASEFIYVSFGSLVQVHKMDPNLRQEFFWAFGNSSLRFILKYESTPPDEMPSNVFTGKWMPQQAILSHPNCRGFITHGGLGSIQEAIIFGVPLIVMPLFADQDHNSVRVQDTGIGISLEITTLKHDQLSNAINQLITDPSYKNQILEISGAFKDRENSPVNTAVWWTEKVLRSSKYQLSLLKPGGRSQPWWMRRHLDVILFFLTIILIPFGFLLFLIFQTGAYFLRSKSYKGQTTTINSKKGGPNIAKKSTGKFKSS